ncbi:MULTISPECIES: ABC transporter permease [Paenibacillus]|uniref:ABC transporter permease n=1 Tax=Paenibacillus TaxID=44249 RepID=UPI0022B86B45|nr:ABC transporter permease [Paenibacillus caseinilyticus]MCZ8520270.1 ABC transporter permease [Paenibacillus caseinilyticus]
MRTIGIIAWHELLRYGRHPRTFLILLALPLLLIFILGSALPSSFGAEETSLRPLQVAVLQPPGAEGAMKRCLAGPAFRETVRLRQAGSREELIGVLQDGTADYGVVAPELSGKGEAIGTSGGWELVAGRDRERSLLAQSLIRGCVADGMPGQADASAAGQPASVSGDGPGSGSGPAGPAVEVRKLAGSGRSYTAMQYYAASMLLMFLLYSSMMAAISLAAERENKTLQRLASLPVPLYEVVLGKAAAGLLLALLQAAAIVAGSSLLLGVDWGGEWSRLFGVCAVFAAGAAGLAVLIGVFARSIRTVMILFQFLILASTFLSGGFEPNVGPFLTALSKGTLNYWGMHSLLGLMTGQSLASLLSYGIPLAWMGAGLAAAAAIVYRKAGYHS